MVSVWREQLEAALQEARGGRHREALVILDNALERLRDVEPPDRVAALARSAATIAQAFNQEKRAVAYLWTAIRFEPDDASLYLFLGELHTSLGLDEDARHLFATCAEVAERTGDAEILEIVKSKRL